MEIKKNDDLVRLVNKGKESRRSTHDGSPYEVQAESEIVVRRDIANQLIKNTSFFVNNSRTATLEIVELPIGQRQKSPGEFPKLTQENANLSAENSLLKEKIKELVEQNSALEVENKKLKKK